MIVFAAIVGVLFSDPIWANEKKGDWAGEEYKEKKSKHVYHMCLFGKALCVSVLFEM